MQQTAQIAPSAAPAAPAEPVDIFLTHLPANLRAKFGRAQCRRLLADQNEVQRVWSRLQPVLPLSAAAATDSSHGNQTMHLRQPHRLPPLKQHHPAVKQPDWYVLLSEQFNSDYSAGVTMPRRFGHTQETHDKAILERSPEFNNTADGVNKHRRDDFAAYNEVVHVERKFNNFWAAERGRQDQQRPVHRPQEVRKPATVQQQPQSAPVSILMSGGKSATSTATAKRVTISNGNEGMDRGGVGGQESLHKANSRTVQQREV